MNVPSGDLTYLDTITVTASANSNPSSYYTELSILYDSEVVGWCDNCNSLSTNIFIDHQTNTSLFTAQAIQFSFPIKSGSTTVSRNIKYFFHFWIDVNHLYLAKDGDAGELGLLLDDPHTGIMANNLIDRDDWWQGDIDSETAVFNSYVSLGETMHLYLRDEDDGVYQTLLQIDITINEPHDWLTIIGKLAWYGWGLWQDISVNFGTTSKTGSNLYYVTSTECNPNPGYIQACNGFEIDIKAEYAYSA